MTKKDAIDIIKSECYVFNPLNFDRSTMVNNALDMAVKALEKEPILDKLRAEIAEYDSIWVEYKITGRRDKDIEQLVSDVLSQAKKQMLEVIDKYKAESEVD